MSVRKFPNVICVLIVSEKCHVPFIPGIHIHRFHLNEIAHEIQLKLSHPSEFRDNFWAYSLMRLVAIHDYICQSSREIIHVESDVVLASDFPFDRFENLPRGIAFPMVSPTQGIASILYLRDEESSSLILEEIRNQICRNSATTDMLVLGSVFGQFPNNVQLLPTAPASSLTLSFENAQMKNLDFGVEHFEGFFDGADIGCFLTGYDPRNYKGRRHIRVVIEGNFVNPRKLKLTYSLTRDFLDIRELPSNNPQPIFNLHIHSKDLRFFRENSADRILEKRIRNSDRPESSEWSLRAIIQVIYLAMMRRIKLLFKEMVKHGTDHS